MDPNQNPDVHAEISHSPVATGDRGTVWLICLGLAALTLAVFGQTITFGFVNHDDNVYGYETAAVTNGLTGDGLARAFSHGSSNLWDPLTTVSHMLDCQIFGLNAGGHHLTNVLLHMASVVLLFLVLRKLTGALWPCAFVAALFVIHPLRAESVAWVTERKDVLSGLFFMLTLGAYARYVEGPAKLSRYLLVVLFFVMGLMSKVMLVTVPLILLVLDCWPLGRISDLRFTIYEPTAMPSEQGGQKKLSSFAWCLIEKLPLLTLSVAAGVVTLVVQKRDDVVGSLLVLPMGLKLANAVVSVAIYLRQMVWPSQLTVFYPFPMGGLPVGAVAASVLLVAVISATAILCRRTRPYLLAGWLWYLIMLLPVIGLLQAGRQAHADRYTYLPQIGLYLALAWLAANWAGARRERLLLIGGMGAGIVVVLSICAFNQVSYWRNSETLWRHALAIPPELAMAHDDLGMALLAKGRRPEAVDEFRQAMKVDAGDYNAHNNLGMTLADEGRTEEAMTELHTAIQLQPDGAAAHNNLGSTLANAGRTNEALAEFRLAAKLQPGFALAHNNLSRLLAQMGLTGEAIAESQTTLMLQPDLVNTRFNLAGLLAQEGKTDEAMAQYQMVMDAAPRFAEARYDLATLLYRRGRMDEAIAQLQSVLAIQPDFAPARQALGLIAWDMATSPDDGEQGSGRTGDPGGRVCGTGPVCQGRRHCRAGAGTGDVTNEFVFGRRAATAGRNLCVRTAVSRHRPDQ
jgi:protein O-mannosyl-transferase